MNLPHPAALNVPHHRIHRRADKAPEGSSTFGPCPEGQGEKKKPPKRVVFFSGGSRSGFASVHPIHPLLDMRADHRSNVRSYKAP